MGWYVATTFINTGNAILKLVSVARKKSFFLRKVFFRQISWHFASLSAVIYWHFRVRGGLPTHWACNGNRLVDFRDLRNFSKIKALRNARFRARQSVWTRKIFLWTHKTHFLQRKFLLGPRGDLWRLPRLCMFEQNPKMPPKHQMSSSGPLRQCWAAPQRAVFKISEIFKNKWA